MHPRTAIIVLVGIASVSPCAAQIALPIQILPVMAKVSGAAGTDWMSSLSVSNIGHETADVTALFFREDQSNIPLLGPSHVFVLGPGETLTTHDVLGEWYPSEGNTKGFLVVIGESDTSEEDPFVLSVAGRVFNNANPEATYGQAVPSGILGLMVAPGASNLTGARLDEHVRSNLGVVNLSLFPLDMVITTFGADGTILSSVQRRVQSYSLSQWSLSQLGVASLSTPGRIEVKVDPNSITWDPCFGEEPDLDNLQGIFMTYLSRVDQVTGDADFMLGSSDWYDYIARCEEVPSMIPAHLAFSAR